MSRTPLRTLLRRRVVARPPWCVCVPYTHRCPWVERFHPIALWTRRCTCLDVRGFCRRHPKNHQTWEEGGGFRARRPGASRSGLIHSDLSSLRKSKGVQEKGLRWHVCRVNLARKIFFELRISYEKCSEIFPEMFEPLFCGLENPTKFPANFPLNFPNLPAKNQKNSPTSFCRSAGRRRGEKALSF